MSLTVRQFNELSSEELNRLGRFPLSGVFYSKFLLQIWRDEYQWDACVLSTDTATLTGLIKNTPLGSIFYSLPFGWYGGIIGDSPAADDISEIFQWLEDKAFLQENITQLHQEKVVSAYPDRYRRHEMKTHVLKLQEDVGFSENTRRNIKKSKQASLKITGCRKNDQLRFLSLLREQTARTQERRRLPEHFYSQLFSRGCSQGGDVRLVGVEEGGELCAAHIYFCSESDVFYFDGVASEKGAAAGANFMIFDRIITQSREQGLQRLNFGATPAGDAGLERFKSGWGAEVVSYSEYSRRSLLKQGIDFMVRR